MPRLQWFEFNDLRWFPDVLRQFITDHLSFWLRRAYLPTTIRLALLLRQSGQRRIVDLCSGSGWPIASLLPGLSAGVKAQVSACLTDLYPNRPALKTICEHNPNLSWRASAVDATRVPEDLDGLRTVFSAFHHFEPERARQVLLDSVRRGMPIAVFEVQQRRISSIVGVPLMMFAGSFLLTPFIGRVSLARLALTYVLPVAPLCIAWDSLVSCLRSYTPEELMQLTQDEVLSPYQWQSGQLRARGPLGSYRISFLTGLPHATETKRA